MSKSTIIGVYTDTFKNLEKIGSFYTVRYMDNESGKTKNITYNLKAPSTVIDFIKNKSIKINEYEYINHFSNSPVMRVVYEIK